MNQSRTLLCLVFCSFFVAKAIAQPVVSSSDMFVAGDKEISYLADTDNVDYGTGGADQLWDYSGLKLITSLPDSLTFEYLDPSGTPFFPDFPGAILCSHLAGDGYYTYMKYDNSTSALTEIGFAYGSSTDAIIETYDRPELFIKYPINSSYDVTNNFSATGVGKQVTQYHKGTITIKADGYGTLKLPRYTYRNVLRLHVHGVSTDSSYTLGSLTVQSIVTDEYRYITPGIKNTLLSISRDDQYLYGRHITGRKGVKYYDRARVIVNNERDHKDASVKIFPDPVRNLCTLSLESDKNAAAEISIINMLGQVVKTYPNLSLQNGANSFTIDMSGYNNGCYVVRLDSDGYSVSRKILLQ